MGEKKEVSTYQKFRALCCSCCRRKKGVVAENSVTAEEPTEKTSNSEYLVVRDGQSSQRRKYTSDSKVITFKSSKSADQQIEQTSSLLVVKDSIKPLRDRTQAGWIKGRGYIAKDENMQWKEMEADREAVTQLARSLVDRISAVISEEKKKGNLNPREKKSEFEGNSQSQSGTELKGKDTDEDDT